MSVRMLAARHSAHGAARRHLSTMAGYATTKQGLPGPLVTPAWLNARYEHGQDQGLTQNTSGGGVGPGGLKSTPLSGWAWSSWWCWMARGTCPTQVSSWVQPSCPRRVVVRHTDKASTYYCIALPWLCLIIQAVGAGHDALGEYRQERIPGSRFISGFACKA